VATEESFNAEDEAFFQSAASDAADSVRPVTLDGHTAESDGNETPALASAPDPRRFVRPVQRVVAVLAALSAIALAREVLRAPPDRIAAAPAANAANAPNAVLAFNIEAPADDLACSPFQTGPTSDDPNASSVQDASFASIGPPAPPTPVAPRKPRFTQRSKVAITPLRAAPTPSVARTKSLSTAALLHAVRAQHGKAPLQK
jgi:hypothetical protein